MGNDMSQHNISKVTVSDKKGNSEMCKKNEILH